MESRIEKRIALQAPVARVWRALTDYREFGQWFRVKLDGPFVPGQVLRGHITYPGYEHLDGKPLSRRWSPNDCSLSPGIPTQSPKRLFNGNANTRRIRIGEDPNWNAASGHRVRLRQNPQ